MKIVAIDTTEQACSVALFNDEQIFEEYAIAPKQHNQLIFGMLDTLFAKANIRIQDCDAIAFTRGPGSFTGVRIACSVAHGLAVATERPLIAISSLEALAMQAVRSHQASFIIAGLDARMEEIYWAGYQFQNDQLEITHPEQLSHSQLAADVMNENTIAIGSAWLTHSAPNNAIILSEAKVHAQDVAQLAKRDFQLGKLLTPEQAQPVYLRNQVTGGVNG